MLMVPERGKNNCARQIASQMTGIKIKSSIPTHVFHNCLLSAYHE